MPGGKHREPPPRLYARLAQGSLMRLIYRRLINALPAPEFAHLLRQAAAPDSYETLRPAHHIF